jgi:hypothetical protein
VHFSVNDGQTCASSAPPLCPPLQGAGVIPYLVHTTFQFAGLEGKRHRLREAKLWADPPEYYNHPRG